MSSERTKAVDITMRLIRQTMEAGVNNETLAAVEAQLASLAAHADLFDEESFPQPTETTDRTFLIHDTDGEFALYLCTSKPGLEYTAHDHGGSWAVIAAVSGPETHRFYEVQDGLPHIIGETECKPGTPVSMLPDGIHSIHAGDQPLVHLHLYGLAFERQTERREFDAETGSERRFELDNFSFVEDCR